MDDQDFDQTQAIFLEDFDQETDEEDKDKQKPVRGWLWFSLQVKN